MGFRNEIYLFLFDHILYLFFDALFKFWVSFLKTGVPFVVLKIQIFSQFPNHKAGHTGLKFSKSYFGKSSKKKKAFAEPLIFQDGHLIKAQCAVKFFLETLFFGEIIFSNFAGP